MNDWTTQWPCTVTVRGERAAIFREVLGTDEVPVISPWAQRCIVPERGEVLAFMLALKAVTAEQRERLCRYLSRRFEVPLEQAREILDAEGVPILAEDCSVTCRSLGLLNLP